MSNTNIQRYRLIPRPPTPLIPPSVLTTNPNPQVHCPLLTVLPLELIHFILFLASKSILDKLFISLSCKLLAVTLAQTKSLNLSRSKSRSRFRSASSTGNHGVLLRSSTPKQVSRDSLTGQITLRTRFMHGLKCWIKEEDGFRLCSVCLVFRRKEGEWWGEEEWRSLRRGGDRNVRKEIAKGKGKGDAEGEKGSGEIPDGEGNGEREEEGEEDVLWVCPKHRVEASRMVQLRDR